MYLKIQLEYYNTNVQCCNKVSQNVLSIPYIQSDLQKLYFRTFWIFNADPMHIKLKININWIYHILGVCLLQLCLEMFHSDVLSYYVDKKRDKTQHYRMMLMHTAIYYLHWLMHVWVAQGEVEGR